MSLKRLKGQDKAQRLLSSIMEGRKIPSVFLFSGPRGVGKKIAAEAFVAALLCSQKTESSPPCRWGQETGDLTPLCESCAAIEKGIHPDVKRVDAGYQGSLREEESFKQRTLRVDTIRHLRQEMSLEPLMGGWKAAIVDDADTLETQSANALLKILEEPPRRTLWILLSSKPEILPKTVLSRAVKISFRALPASVVSDVLLERGIDPRQAQRAAELSGGSLEKALEALKRERWPEVLTDGPLAAIDASEALPKEAPLARKEVEFAIFSLTQNLSRAYHEGKLPFERLEKSLQELSWIQEAVRSNADPRSAMLLACLEAQDAQRIS